MTAELWRSIPDYPGYEVSDRGRIRSYYKNGGGGLGWHIADEPQRILAASPDSRGYRIVVLKHKSGERHCLKAATIIARVFIGPRPDGLSVCHYDDDPSNDHIENLRYDTPHGNTQDALRNGARFGHRSLDDSEALELRQRYAKGESTATLSRQFKITASNVHAIAAGRSYQDVPGPITSRRHTISDEQIEQMKRLHATGKYFLRELGAMFGRSESQACRLMKGNRRNGASSQ
jgi:hypothetical protein